MIWSNFFLILWDFWSKDNQKLFLCLYRCVCLCRERERVRQSVINRVCVMSKKVSAVDYKKISASCWHKCKRPKGWIKNRICLDFVTLNYNTFRCRKCCHNFSFFRQMPLWCTLSVSSILTCNKEKSSVVKYNSSIRLTLGTWC